MAQVEQIDNADDPRLALYKHVRDREALLEHGIFMAESRGVVRRLLTGSRFATRSVLVHESAFENMRDVLEGFEGEDGPTVYVAPNTILEQITGFQFHRGCVAIGERGAQLGLTDLIPKTEEPVLLVGLETVTDPDNVGSIFRSAAAFGVAGVVLSPHSVDPLYRKAIRTSIGTTLSLPFARAESWPGELDTLRARGFTVVAVTPDDEADAIADIAARAGERVLLMLGNEGDGLSAEMRTGADLRARIPLVREIDSLNVGTAAGVALYLFSNPGVAKATPHRI